MDKEANLSLEVCAKLLQISLQDQKTKFLPEACSLMEKTHGGLPVCDYISKTEFHPNSVRSPITTVIVE